MFLLSEKQNFINTRIKLKIVKKEIFLFVNCYVSLILQKQKVKMKRNIFFALLSIVFISISAKEANVPIKNISYQGPYTLKQPWQSDSVDVNNKPFSISSFLEGPFNFSYMPSEEGDTIMVFDSKENEIHYLSFPLKNEKYAKVKLTVEGIKDYKTFLDNKVVNNDLKLTPGTRKVGIKFLTKKGEKDTIRIKLSSPQAQYVNTEKWNKGRAFTLDDVIYADHFNNVKISPSGKYAIVTDSRTTPDKKTKKNNKVIKTEDGKVISQLSNIGDWMPNEDLIWYTDVEKDGSINIITFNPETLEENIFAEKIPEGNFIITPDYNKLIYFTFKEGPKEDKEIYRVLNPEDRQEGYRNRFGLALYDLKSGIYSPLTFGNKNIMLQDVNKDSNKILLMESRNRFEKRPTTVFSLFELSLNDIKVDTLVFEDGFISGASYSPDGTQIAITGSPEALGGIGKNVPDGRIPSMTDGQLYIMDLNTKNINPISKDFNPAIELIEWHKASGNIYFIAEDKDKKSLFEYDPKTGKIKNLKAPEDIVSRFSIAENSLKGAFVGESAGNPDVLYFIDFKKGNPFYKKIEAKGEKLLSEVALAEVVDWDFINSKGDTINGRYYLPPDFDPNKKYPLIVNYYGGCSPTSRNFASRYPHHVYANQGYVVYVLNPSGATGFGQEFASRHVNTAGKGVAEDIIEGTEKFVEEHPYIDKDKIGCIGASYGGFMTQYLQTVTDLFAAAISHAGISDHTSYWGNGYWGYSYSEVSMAESYPWSDTDLYVKQSPLYNADKINTPILFLHGDEDTNVPPMESIQLFTALKLLGKDTALVEVTGQNHHILDFDKRQKWQDTIFAWFAKYLQDDASWWDALYPPSPLE